MVPDVWWGNHHGPNKNDVDCAGKQSMKALNQIMNLPNFWRIHKQFMFLEKRSVIARVFVGDMSTTVVNHGKSTNQCFNYVSIQLLAIEKKMFTRKSPETSWSFGVKITVVPAARLGPSQVELFRCLIDCRKNKQLQSLDPLSPLKKCCWECRTCLENPVV